MALSSSLSSFPFPFAFFLSEHPPPQGEISGASCGGSSVSEPLGVGSMAPNGGAGGATQRSPAVSPPLFPIFFKRSLENISKKFSIFSKTFSSFLLSKTFSHLFFKNFLLFFFKNLFLNFFFKTFYAIFFLEVSVEWKGGWDAHMLTTPRGWCGRP